ncbi:MAG: beta strand repeat-containing protein, partial [Acetobacteraceae bacterium]
GFTLADAQDLRLAGLLDAGTGAVQLNDPGFAISEQGGSITAGFLAGSGASATLTDANLIGTLGAFATSNGGFTLTDQENLTLAGLLDAGTGAVQLNDPGFAITEQGGSITADILGIGTPGSVVQSASLTGNNVIGTLDAVSVSGGFTLADAKDLTLAGLVDAGSVQLNDPGFAITEQGGSIAAGILAGSAALIALTDPANRIASLGAITSPGGLTLATATDLSIAGMIATGVAPISLSSGGTIAEIAGGTLTGGALTGSASAASFANTNSITELGSFTAPGGFTLDNGGDLQIAGLLDAGTATALLITGGSLFETGGAITAGTLTGSAGNVSLTNGANRIANLGSFTSDAFNLTDGEALAVIGTVTGNPIGLTVNGNLALGNGAGNAVLSSTGAVFLIASGAVTEPAGAIDATILTGSAGSVSLPGANLVPLLGPFTTPGPFLLNAAEPTLTVNGPLSAGSASLAAAGNLLLAGPVSADAVTLRAGGAISESGGIISAGTLAGSASDATLTAANTIATLGAFSVPGTLLLADEASLAVAGPVSASFFGIADPSGVSFTGATDVGTLSITAGGSITEPTGTVTAALLEGSAQGLVQLGPDAPAGSASITTLGPFSVSTGTFTLTNSIPLSITGPFSANDFAITAPGNITVTNASITTVGLPAGQQSGMLPARPGSYFDVTGTGGRFLELGRTTINADGGPATVRIQLDPAGGLISFADLVAPTTTLILDTGAGTAIGTIDIAALMVLGNLGSATLSGTVANLSGAVASAKATISPFQSAHYRLNACALMSVNCIVIAPMSVPEGNPLSGLAIVSAPPNQQDIDLLLPNVAAQDY